MFDIEKHREDLCLMALNIDAKYEGKLTFTFKNYIRNWEIFARALEGLKMWTFMGSLKSKVENV